MDRDIAISVKNLSKTYNKGERRLSLSAILNGKLTDANNLPKFKALDDVSFSIEKGCFYGIIGSNGSGKSTLLRILLGSIRPDPGSEVYTNGSVIKLSMGMGFNNQLTARDNIYINGSIIGMSFKEIGESFDDILEFAGVSDFVDVPLKNFSSGMRARLAFAIAINTKADVLLLDEFFGGVGDEEFRAKSMKAFEDLLDDGKTVVLVSHSLKLVQENCSKVLLLNKGKQIIEGDPLKVIEVYQDIVKKKMKS